MLSGSWVKIIHETWILAIYTHTLTQIYECINANALLLYSLHNVMYFSTLFTHFWYFWLLPSGKLFSKTEEKLVLPKVNTIFSNHCGFTGQINEMVVSCKCNINNTQFMVQYYFLILNIQNPI